jgi:hypothetical protein
MADFSFILEDDKININKVRNIWGLLKLKNNSDCILKNISLSFKIKESGMRLTAFYIIDEIKEIVKNKEYEAIIPFLFLKETKNILVRLSLNKCEEGYENNLEIKVNYENNNIQSIFEINKKILRSINFKNIKVLDILIDEQINRVVFTNLLDKLEYCFLNNEEKLYIKNIILENIKIIEYSKSKNTELSKYIIRTMYNFLKYIETKRLGYMNTDETINRIYDPILHDETYENKYIIEELENKSKKIYYILKN